MAFESYLKAMSTVFSFSELKLGEEYFQNGNVLAIRFAEGFVKARVKGKSGRLYNVHIELKSWPKKPAVCTCLQGNCKHAAASLFALQNNMSFAPIVPTSSTLKLKDSFTKINTGPIIKADDLDWYSEIKNSESDFFSYAPGILLNGKQLSIVPLIAELIADSAWQDLSDDASVLLNLPDGERLEISVKRIRPLINLLLSYGQSFKGANSSVKLKAYQLMLIQEAEKALAATEMRLLGDEALRARLKQLLSRDLSLVSLPKNLTTSLRDYQHYGLSWLQFLRGSNFSGILADDMGLGKTIQTLAHLLLEKEQGRLTKPSLVVVPTSLVMTWFEESNRYTQDLKILVYHGLKRENANFADYDLIISTYGLIQRQKDIFLKYKFYYVILDEAQFIKNSRTKTTQCIQQIKSDYRLCLTGTPLENHLGELWSLFNFLMPGLLEDRKTFRKYFKLPIEKDRDLNKQSLLSKRISPFMLRRTKSQVLEELPDKTEILTKIELVGAQRDLYETIRMSMEKKVRLSIAEQGFSKSHIILLDALLKLRQICCDPRLVTIPGADIAHGHSAKLTALMNLLDNLVDEGRRVLVFSQFRSMLELIEEQLNKRKYPYLKLTGQTVNRHALISRFQEGKTPIFLISLRAGGTGLNLTQADTVIHYDPWWNPAVEDQATDRSHRIGQKNPVFVYKLITSSTVEEAILAMQSKKRALFSGILSGDITEFQLTLDDIDSLFMPMKDAE